MNFKFISEQRTEDRLILTNLILLQNSNYAETNILNKFEANTVHFSFENHIIDLQLKKYN